MPPQSAVVVFEGEVPPQMGSEQLAICLQKHELGEVTLARVAQADQFEHGRKGLEDIPIREAREEIQSYVARAGHMNCIKDKKDEAFLWMDHIYCSSLGEACKGGGAMTSRQPKALYLIASVQMWECFSFYGMRVLLVLYMINILHFTDAKAFGIFALYTGLVELGGIIGGMLADRFLGLRRAISLGGWLIASGHLTLAFGCHSQVFFPALALIIVGSSLFLEPFRPAKPLLCG